jgi:uncharacterized protein YjbI with pentapeptide repeats
MRRLFACATVLLLTAPAWADWDGGDCIHCDLRDADLSGADLSSANFSGASLYMADLRDAQFCNTVMPDGTTLYSGC